MQSSSGLQDMMAKFVILTFTGTMLQFACTEIHQINANTILVRAFEACYVKKLLENNSNIHTESPGGQMSLKLSDNVNMITCFEGVIIQNVQKWCDGLVKSHYCTLHHQAVILFC
jgi:hypothetical protein